MHSANPGDPRQSLRDLLDGFALSGAHELILRLGDLPEVRTEGVRRPLRGWRAFTSDVFAELQSRISETGLVSAPSGWFSVKRQQGGPDQHQWVVTAFNPLHQVSETSPA